MVNRKATFAKRQRETDLKDRAKQKEDRRAQKRGEVRENKGPQIAWDEAVHTVTSDELPSLDMANQGTRAGGGAGAEGPPDDGDGEASAAATKPAISHPAPDQASPRPRG